MGWGRKFLPHTRLFVHSGFCTNAQLLPIQKHSTFLKMIARIIVYWPLERGVWPHKKPSHHLVPPLLWGLTLSFGAGGALVWPWGGVVVTHPCGLSVLTCATSLEDRCNPRASAHTQACSGLSP